MQTPGHSQSLGLVQMSGSALQGLKSMLQRQSESLPCPLLPTEKPVNDLAATLELTKL